MEELNSPTDGPQLGERTVAPMKLVLQPSGMAVELNKPETVVGRHMTADLRLPLPDVSRHHCRFVFVEEQWHVFDLNSLNGVFVNSQRVSHCILQHGDSIRLGGFTFQVELSAATIAISSASNRVLKSISDVLDTQSAPKRQAS
jgi:pSer/pThr/pTyr-binding forkhead associated (FHA) protein